MPFRPRQPDPGIPWRRNHRHRLLGTRHRGGPRPHRRTRPARAIPPLRPLRRGRPTPGAGSFDLAYVTWGTICWLPDIGRWAETVAHFLKPGGALYFADAHPAAYVFDDLAGPDADGRPGWFTPYFGRAPILVEDASDYIDAAARLSNTRQVTWLHPLADILAALQAAGLRLDWLREHPRVTWQMFKTLVPDADACWTWPGPAWLPLSLSLRAVRG